VNIKASSINRVDAQIRMGHYQAYTPLPFNLGFDGSGIVEKVGNEVTSFKVGGCVYLATIFVLTMKVIAGNIGDT
jgi:NADPH2:quinone reductase